MKRQIKTPWPDGYGINTRYWASVKSAPLDASVVMLWKKCIIGMKVLEKHSRLAAKFLSIRSP